MTKDQIIELLAQIANSIDAVREKQSIQWDKKQSALEQLALIPISRRHYEEWNKATHAIHDAVVELKDLDNAMESLRKQMSDTQDELRKMYPPKPVAIPKDVIKRSKYYEGDDA